MTYAPGDLNAIRQYLINMLTLASIPAGGRALNPADVGIVGDAAHRGTGGYHEGKDDLSAAGRRLTDYSVRQERDRRGLTDAASALDIGQFSTRVAGQLVTQGTLGMIIVSRMVFHDPRVDCVREVIYSPDGRSVSHYDVIGEQRSADLSHLTHTHISFWRDTEGHRDRFLSLLKDILEREERRPMAVLARRAAEPHVWLCDGIIRRWVPDENQLKDIRYLGTSWQIRDLYYDGAVQVVVDLEAYGVPVSGSMIPPDSVESTQFPGLVRFP